MAYSESCLGVDDENEMDRGGIMEIKLNYQEKGEGKPFILLHGNGEDNSYFVHQMDYFSRKYRMIAVDTRGHGQSPRGTAPFAIGQFADDLKDFMDELDISKAVILGFSDGANIAMIFALRYPERVTALILNGGNLNPKGVKPITQIPIEIGYRIVSKFAAKSSKARKNAEMLGLMVNDPNIEAEELSRITVPTLVISGTKDMIKESHTKEIAKAIPNAKLAIIEGSHFIAKENSEVFNRVVENWLVGV